MDRSHCECLDRLKDWVATYYEHKVPWQLQRAQTIEDFLNHVITAQCKPSTDQTSGEIFTSRQNATAAHKDEHVATLDDLNGAISLPSNSTVQHKQLTTPGTRKESKQVPNLPSLPPGPPSDGAASTTPLVTCSQQVEKQVEKRVTDKKNQSTRSRNPEKEAPQRNAAFTNTGILSGEEENFDTKGLSGETCAEPFNDQYGDMQERELDQASWPTNDEVSLLQGAQASNCPVAETPPLKPLQEGYAGRSPYNTACPIEHDDQELLQSSIVLQSEKERCQLMEITLTQAKMITKLLEDQTVNQLKKLVQENMVLKDELSLSEDTIRLLREERQHLENLLREGRQEGEHMVDLILFLHGRNRHMTEVIEQKQVQARDDEQVIERLTQTVQERDFRLKHFGQDLMKTKEAFEALKRLCRVQTRGPTSSSCQTQEAQQKAQQRSISCLVKCGLCSTTSVKPTFVRPCLMRSQSCP